MSGHAFITLYRYHNFSLPLPLKIWFACVNSKMCWMLLHKSYYLCFTIYAYKNWSFLHTNNVLHLYRYHFTVTSVMVKMVKFLIFNSSSNISIYALQLHVCIANVHLNSLDNIYCTFEKLFFYTLSLPLPAVSAGMAHLFYLFLPPSLPPSLPVGLSFSLTSCSFGNISVPSQLKQ